MDQSTENTKRGVAGDNKEIYTILKKTIAKLPFYIDSVAYRSDKTMVTMHRGKDF